jgi:tetratricopeptide (TPR) repeat protein
VLVFTADAGWGKTRLAAQIARVAFGAGGGGFDPGTAAGGGRAGADGARVLSVRCAAYGERWRLGPLADLVRVAVGLPDPGTTPITRAAAEERLRRVAAVVTRRTGEDPHLPTEALLTMLGLPEPSGGGRTETGTRSRTGSRTHGLSARSVFDRTDLETGLEPTGSAGPAPRDDPAADPPGPRKDEAPIAVAQLLSALAQDAPVVVIVDDLQDASPATMDVLGTMLGRLTGPVLVVLLGRPELVRPAGALTRLADAEVHPLTPLRGAEMARLLSAHLGGGKLPAAQTDRLLATAQGNPFYLAELITLLIERGLLTGDTAGWQLAPGSLSGRLLSRDLAAVLAARIDALHASSRAILRDAAVIGDTVPRAALAALRDDGDGRPGTGPDPELDQALAELLQRRMLMPSRGGYAFATPLLREAAYAGIGKADLSDRHARLARWASSLLGSRAHPQDEAVAVPSLGWTAETVDAFIADHAERAAALADAVSLRPDAAARDVARLGVASLGRLARRALLAGEPGQAAEFGTRARKLAGHQLPVSDRLGHASALVQLGRTEEALAELTEILGEQPGLAGERAAHAGTPGVDPASRARALLLAGRAHLARGDTDSGDRAWAQALRVASDAGLPTERAEAMRRIGMEEYRRGRLQTAQAGFREALAIAQSSGDRRGEAWALQNLAWVQTTLGDFSGAEETLTRAARLFAELGNLTGRAWLRGTTAFSRLLAGRLHEARRLADAFLPFGERVGERWAVGTLRAVAAFAGAELGELTEADELARQAYAAFDAVDDDWGRGLALVVRGVVARGQGRPVPARDLLDQACRYAERTGHPLLLGIAHTVRGFAALEAGDLTGAEADASRVLEVADPYGVAAAALVGPRVLLGRVLLARGDVDAAVRTLEEAATTALDGAAANASSVLLSPRRAVAEYAEALLAAGRVEEALAVARRAMELPAEDVRGRLAADRVLARASAAAGDHAAVPA